MHPELVPTLTIENWEDYTEMTVGDEITLQTDTEEGDLNLYKWYLQERNLDNNPLWINDTNTYDSLVFPTYLEGEYLLKVSGRHTETNLWTENFSMTILVYNVPLIHVEFDSRISCLIWNCTINEGEWITFDASGSFGFWNGSESLGPQELNLNYNWDLDGEMLAGSDEIVTVLIETGGTHTIRLTLSQEPVGEAYFEITFYADYKPWGVLNTHPANPRYTEDFEVYLNAYDE
jgi:hypothetical protein